ncbi:IclR family transcriptional regulator domain-containing protein [Sphingopyxis macrogoltabida]|uniref:IclR family transcriptional regulator n=1 Tax=Sphingopyxis macrogoltabida TaxID=33050 RepID=A0AAC9FG36_SPHMC|nr:IclR family transcriptional regulator C-terminal domain-containing protein [Sphingopyxis macrogoltabida]ALJ14724.1 IclR family transcriptional regulator [Sphingopyxis macrogoltabida]AMU90980.1 IclR family transcriptional regulator [Sphingopyxis macrogoltabida]
MPRTSRTAEQREALDALGPDFLEGTARSLRIFTLFGGTNRRMTLSEVAKAVGMSRATVRRTLYTLAALEYLDVEGNTFGLTPKVLSFAAAYLTSDIVPTVMQPLVDKLSAQLNEACGAAVLQGTQTVMIARASPVRALTLDLRVGYALPAYCSSVGRILLGGLDPADLTEMLDRSDLLQLTPDTIIDKEVLKARIIADREQGYSIVDREVEQGFRSIAVPVRQIDGKVRCALHVGVHTERATMGQMIDRFLPLLRATAQEAQGMLI